MTDYGALPARELDALVARDVMGWTYVPGDHIWRNADCETVALLGEWSPSTDGRAMLAVLDALRGRGLEFNIESSESGWMVCAFPASIKQAVSPKVAATLPRAVAEAALAAVGGK